MQWSCLMPQEAPGTSASSKSREFLSDFHSQPETSVFHGRLAGAHCTAAPWHCPCSVGKLPSSWHLNKFRSNSSPWLLKTRTKTTLINYCIQGPGGNLKTSSQGQGFSGNRSLLTRGRAPLSSWLHPQDNCTTCICSMLEQQTGTHGADWQYTKELTLTFHDRIQPK